MTWTSPVYVVTNKGKVPATVTTGCVIREVEFQEGEEADAWAFSLLPTPGRRAQLLREEVSRVTARLHRSEPFRVGACY
jgi:hypothetical protein